MIQTETSRSGHFILKRDGRFLASSFDPVREGHVWAAHAVGTAEALGCHTFLVLGLGCGYHVSSLSSAMTDAGHVDKKILVIEASAEVAKETLAQITFAPNVTVLVEPLARQLLGHAAICEALSDTHVVLPHHASFACDLEFYSFAQSLLLSRDMTSFLLQLRLHPELYAAFDQTELRRLAASNDPVTIQTLRQLFRKDGKLSHERRMWKALEELIA
jgi:hypothetical protein